MKMTQKQLTVVGWNQKIVLLAILLTLVAYDFGIVSRLATHIFWLAEFVIYYTIDFLTERLFNK